MKTIHSVIYEIRTASTPSCTLSTPFENDTSVMRRPATAPDRGCTSLFLESHDSTLTQPQFSASDVYLKY